MNEECFVKALEHFVKHVNPTKENPALILMDNHSSHVNLRFIAFAKENSIIILQFPPHLRITVWFVVVVMLRVNKNGINAKYAVDGHTSRVEIREYLIIFEKKILLI